MSLYSKLFTKEVLEEAFETHGSPKAMVGNKGSTKRLGIGASTLKRYADKNALNLLT